MRVCTRNDFPPKIMNLTLDRMPSTERNGAGKALTYRRKPSLIRDGPKKGAWWFRKGPGKATEDNPELRPGTVKKLGKVGNVHKKHQLNQGTPKNGEREGKRERVGRVPEGEVGTDGGGGRRCSKAAGGPSKKASTNRLAYPYIYLVTGVTGKGRRERKGQVNLGLIAGPPRLGRIKARLGCGGGGRKGKEEERSR